MPGFLGGSTGGSGTGGEISFPKEFVDPVTKLRVSQPENLIDTDFEYGLQPTKWETVELINNTPSFFSKSGDTTIPGIRSITTNAGTREITVTIDFDHGLSAGIPISVTGTKSVTADGAYIINSIPNTTTFTYLCKANQSTTSSIEDLYSSIITGEFFQGSQLRISDASGIVTDDASTSVLTVTTESSHGFKVNTPFYFLNLNSTISQDFPATNNTAKSFDSTNSATAQTFDGSNTLSSINIDWSNSSTVGGVTSNVSSVSVPANTITVTHGSENFAGGAVGTPLYYAVTGGAGYFTTNPRGVVFLKTINGLGASTSTFQISAIPDGPVIPITASISGTFQLANQARTFAGNNVNPLTQTTLTILKGDPKVFDATNTLGTVGTQTAYSAGNITVNSSVVLDWYFGSMVFYSTSGAAASGLVNNTTYFVDSFFRQGTSDNYSFTLKTLPSAAVITSISGGTGTQTFRQIGLSLDRDIFHVKDNGFENNDMLEYEFPVDGRFAVADSAQIKNFYFIETRYDAHNFTLNQTTGDITPATLSRTVDRGTAITPTTATPVGLTAPITYAVLSGTLPTGLSLNTTTGSVTGTPIEVVTGRVITIRATDVNGSTAFQVQTYTINATVGSISPETVSRENIFALTPITATTATTVNLVAPITWEISSGVLPTGLALNTSNGVVSGTPSEVIAVPGRQVVVRATDVGGLQGFQTITFQINQPPNLYNFTSASFTPGGAQRENGPSIGQTRSGVGNPSWATQYIQSTSQQGIFLWTVPETATYRIEAYGARGGTTGDAGQAYFGFYEGGYGARMRGDFPLIQGAQLKMLVGQRGHETSHSQDGRSVSSGGGGSFVTRPDNSILVIAGGGGGSASNSWSQHRGQDGTTNQNGTNSTSGGGQPGTNGQGSNGDTTGGPAAGFFGDGAQPSGTPFSDRALSFQNGGRGGRAARSWGGGEVWGGFGGGGGGGGLAAGGGGGYSGGAGGQWSQYQGGGGGGSINNGANQSNSSGSRNGDGLIVIQKL